MGISLCRAKQLTCLRGIPLRVNAYVDRPHTLLIFNTITKARAALLSPNQGELRSSNSRGLLVALATNLRDLFRAESITSNMISIH